MPIATNDQGQALRLDDSGQWVPTKLATNPNTGERLAFDGDQWVAVPKPKIGVAEDVAKSGGTGILKGVTGVLGGIGDLANLANQGLSHVLPGYTAEPVPFTSGALNKVVGKPFGGLHEPQSFPGQVTQAAGEFLPAAFGGEASLAQRAIGRVLAPALASETAAYAAPEGYKGAARIVGGIAGGLPAAVSAAARVGAERLVPQLADALPPQDAALVQQYEQMGGHLRPGQYAPSNFIRQGDAVLADSLWPRVSGFAENSQHAVLPAQQADEFNRFISQSFGENAPRITDDVIQRARTRIGSIYDTVLPRNSVRSDPQLEQGFGAVEQAAQRAAPAMDSSTRERIQNVLEAIRSQLNDGLPGDLYQAYRRRGGLLDEMAGSSSPALQAAGTALRRTLDDAFARQADPWDAAALQMANQHYRALETIAPLAAKAPTGNINPGLLLNVVNNEYGSAANAGNLGTLARVGAAFLKAQPSSGTSERGIWRSLINKPFSEGIPAVANAAISLPVNAVASRQVNRVINSPAMRARLLANALQNQGATGVPVGPSAPDLARALQQ